MSRHEVRCVLAMSHRNESALHMRLEFRAVGDRSWRAIQLIETPEGSGNILYGAQGAVWGGILAAGLPSWVLAYYWQVLTTIHVHDGVVRG